MIGAQHLAEQRVRARRAEELELRGRGRACSKVLIIPGSPSQWSMCRCLMKTSRPRPAARCCAAAGPASPRRSRAGSLLTPGAQQDRGQPAARRWARNRRCRRRRSTGPWTDGEASATQIRAQSWCERVLFRDRRGFDLRGCVREDKLGLPFRTHPPDGPVRQAICSPTGLTRQAISARVAGPGRDAPSIAASTPSRRTARARRRIPRRACSPAAMAPR